MSMCVCAGQRITENRIMKETTITIKHAVAATRRQKWQQRNTNVNLNFFHNCRSDRSAALSPSHVRACVDVCVCSAVLPCSKWTLLWNVFSILCPLSTPLKQNSNAGADVDSGVGGSGSGSGCYCGCEPWHQKCWPHFPTLHCPLSLSLSLFCTCGCGDRPSDTARRNVQEWGEMVVVVGVGQCFLFRLPYAYFNFCFSLPIFMWPHFPEMLTKYVCVRARVCGVCMCVYVRLWSVNDIKEMLKNMKGVQAKHANPLNPPVAAAGVALFLSLSLNSYLYLSICSWWMYAPA